LHLPEEEKGLQQKLSNLRESRIQIRHGVLEEPVGGILHNGTDEVMAMASGREDEAVAGLVTMTYFFLFQLFEGDAALRRLLQIIEISFFYLFSY